MYAIVYFLHFILYFWTQRRKTLMSGISNTIHVERAKIRMSQEDLAKKVNVTRQTIHAIERGKKTPSVQLALEIANVFKVSVESIFILNSKK
jgi:putative transcriptional regulator